jgi:ubiquinone/menaquinone biosynthesis C-methylase UbiE
LPSPACDRISRLRDFPLGDDYVEYCRETAKHARDLHDLALRGRGKKELTRLIHEHIVEAVDLRAGDDLVDIGCGDGTLLRMAREVDVSSALGLLATDEEVALVRRTGLNVRQGLTDRLPVPDASASVVVCNSVLLVVPRETIPASLREICRIAKPGARIFIGEIPFAEFKDPTPEFKSRHEELSYLYRKHGSRTWFGMLRRMAWEQVSGKSAVIQAGTAIPFFATPEEFVALAQAAGLEPVRHWQSDYPKTRNNYLLRKPN